MGFIYLTEKICENRTVFGRFERKKNARNLKRVLNNRVYVYVYVCRGETSPS